MHFCPGAGKNGSALKLSAESEKEDVKIQLMPQSSVKKFSPCGKCRRKGGDAKLKWITEKSS